MLRRLSKGWRLYDFAFSAIAAFQNRIAAARLLFPLLPAASARDSRSIDNGWPINAGLHQAGTLNQISRPM
jgi:hypothetical protein